jgi:hypothetical protein
LKCTFENSKGGEWEYIPKLNKMAIREATRSRAGKATLFAACKSTREKEKCLDFFYECTVDENKFLHKVCKEIRIVAKKFSFLGNFWGNSSRGRRFLRIGEASGARAAGLREGGMGSEPSNSRFFPADSVLCPLFGP